MLAWVTPSQRLTPNELASADSLSRRRMSIDRYRSRTEVTNEHINAAYAWLRLPVIGTTDLIHHDYYDAFTIYRTIAVPRGVGEQEALGTIRVAINQTIERARILNIITLNTGTAAAASNCIKEFFDNSDMWNELDIRTLVTSAPTHKVNMYKHITNHGTSYDRTTYIILNNLDTPSVIFKIATAIMLDLNLFKDDTEKFANAWLSGNADTVYDTVTNYYAEYKRNKALLQRMEAIEKLSKSMGDNRENEFKRRIQEIEERLNEAMNDIRTYTQRMDAVKGEYLLYKLEDDTKKTEELKTFFKAIGDKLVYVRFNDNKLSIVYRTKLVYFEPDLLRRYLDSTRPNCVTGAATYIKQLLIDIFLERKYDLLIETGAVLYIQDNNVAYMPPENAAETRLSGIPNPHHKYYNCWGDNKPSIVNALINKDYITAISQTFAAMSGLNISDTAVMERFIREELQQYSEVACLEDKNTGEVITISDYRRRFEDASDEANE